ncbi:DUF5074 domain-containing protein [Mariniflexile litorale]|uniref:DUF5074 domain-containing protein n=1 Tax=Mariniflexile litorale TaxID=3045158 RepID=A0AAU7EI24_9FLAO|nr:DUF5074 domain-containing protein [Mariniflexile sp. KMM 9835]MDQ8210773.1 T9SS type A sorting domain-containing protein [Mariniflexile sp. KMM 9835]
MKNYYKNLVTLVSGIFFTVITFAQTYQNGIYILNEGGFFDSNASLSCLKPNLMVENNVFSNKNAALALGDVAQGMGFEGNNAYLVVGNSNYVKVVDRNTLVQIATITDQMVNPRNIAFYDGKGYVTNWGDPTNIADDYVAIIDLATNTVTGTIPVVEGPEELVASNGKLYVAHQGGYGQGNSVSVIDLATNAVEPIIVGDVPSALEMDATNLYVLCSGKPDYAPGGETTGKIVKIDLSDYDNKTTFTFPGIVHPEFLTLDSSSLFYFLGSNIYKMGLSDISLPTTSFIDVSTDNLQIPYALEKIGTRFYVADAVDFSNEGKVFVYDNTGNFVSNYSVGVLPNGFYYNDEPYAPGAGKAGSTAIAATSNLFVAWATGVQVTRGHVDISRPDYKETDKNSNYASYGEPEAGTGVANNSPVSLGDAGEAIVTFAQPIKNEDGFDFAVFENGFSDTFLELAFVEVSSDGINYFRFPSHSKTQTTTQVGGFGSVDPTKLNNLAGKYKANYGTPFDISDIADNVLLDKTSITHIKLIDVVGSIDPLYARYDSLGNAINELFSTPFWSGGFDLDAIGVINQRTLGLNDVKKSNTFTLYPNPASSSFQISDIGTLEIYSMSGRVVLKQELKVKQLPVSINHLVSGIYIVKLTNNNGTHTQKLIKR